MSKFTLRRLLPAVTFGALVSLASAQQPDIVVESATAKLTLSANGAWRGLVDKRTGKDWCWTGNDTRLVEAHINGVEAKPTECALAGTALTLRFASTDTVLTYEIRPEPDWVLFTLRSVTGTRPSHLTVARVPTTITEQVGRVLSLARNTEVAVCLLAANLQSTGSAQPRGTWSDLRVTTQDGPSGPKLEGVTAALILCPAADIQAVIQRAETAFGLPTNTRDGVPSRNLPEARQSYWFLDFGEKDVDTVLDYCRQSGFRQVVISFPAWSDGPGHYRIKARNYPNGVDGLKATVDRFHAAGILVGMHTFASKVSKTDPYVTPVPDKRFWCDMQVTSAEAVSADQTEIRAAESLAEWPGSPVCKQKAWEGGVRLHQDVILDDEIVQYDSIGPEGKYDTFLGCKRGAYGTAAAAHAAGTSGRHYGVDGCINGYIIDQDTTLVDEVTDNLAKVFNFCGFDMVYFDGGEDVDKRRFDYFVTRSQAMSMSKFTKRPLIHMGTCITHGTWHTFTRAGTADVYMGTLRGNIMLAIGAKDELTWVKEVVDGAVRRVPVYEAFGKTVKWRTVRDHIDENVKWAMALENSFIPGELGWFGIWPKDRFSDGLQLDEAEYLMVKSLAYNLPVSFQTGFREMERHPLTPQILQIARTYEELRLNGPAIDDATRVQLRQLQKDFVLLQADGKREFVQAWEVPDVAHSNDRVRAFVGPRGTDAVATVWHFLREGTLTLKTDRARVRAITFLGEPVPLASGTGTVIVPVNAWRTTLLFSGTTADDVRRCLEEGAIAETPPARIWVQAEACARAEGQMAKGSTAGVTEPDALGDVVLCTGPLNREQTQPWFCEYTVDLPRKACYTVWARVRYPTGNDDSFWFAPVGKDGAEGTRVVLGNCGGAAKAWHWTGTGAGTTGAPPGRPITLTLPAGPFTFRVYAREGGGTPETNPRLDCLCIAEDTDYVPSDADARADIR